MPITVKDLIQSRQELTLVTAQYNDFAQTALDKMTENNFSQLPVLGKDDNMIGIITHNLVLNALQTFGIPIKTLRVSHSTYNKVSVCKEDDDLSDVFANVKRDESVVIQSKEGQKPIGIITIFDMLEFYSQRAENIILLNNIETALKEHISVAFTDKEVELRKAIDDVHNRNSQKLDQFKKALKDYNFESERKENLKNEEIILEIFDKNFVDKKKPKILEDLTLDSFIKLLLRNDEYCKTTFNNLESKAIETLFESVRDIRNAIFHFRREIVLDDNKKLRFCSDWLARHPAPILESHSENTQEQSEQTLESDNLTTSLINSDLVDKEVKQVSKELNKNDSRYLKLEEKLSKLSKQGIDRYKFRFKEIERIIEDKLPKATREDRSWWSNDDAQPWVRVGWNVFSINIIEEIVTFIYIPHRKKYIEFFQNLLEELNEKASFQVRFPYQDGRHYITVATISDREAPVANLAYSFTEFRKKFRVELFIDKNDQTKNQEKYECLKSHEEEIESELGGKLMWESMETRPQSRISLVYENEILISDSKDELLKLKEWAVNAMLKFQKVMNEYVSKCSF
ncbi:DUF4268 domain-containing protein [Nostoc sp. 'Peltigera malacea cyanobiont' DB3992]|uniref:DUF4268 domain-containing protein n=1 Tax=Nostoc sp. 'Peltigera malacea cyanobiont' DB3992 TaxID=1206980 RepID=UPI000C04F75B|nr:DUF4268 domain-containing protein [Nostoc sp. 'Peltigera malacea cyanobiont' DB3992]PHM06515.1 hypothetical protein CK516_33025 [Nostoc sp. 'Peltigera malacea cyanobiont' DB3992]